MNLHSHLTYIAAIALLLAYILICKPSEVVEVERVTTDTVTVVKRDTITYTNIVEHNKVVVDTVYVPSEGKDSVAVPISDYRFFEDGKYDITARGFGVSIIDVTTFPKMEQRFVTNTVERTVVLRKWDLYAGFGLSALNDKTLPSIHLTLKTPSKWLISGNIGVYDNSAFYGGTIQYKLTK